MTHEEMAAELRKAGWRVQERLTPANCRHPRMRGSGSMSASGASHSEGYCPDCGHSYRFESPPRPDFNPWDILPMNAA